MNAVALSRAVIGATLLSLTALSCTSGSKKTSGSMDDVFGLTGSQVQTRFPKQQKIGVVELSAARVIARSFDGSATELEYLGTGGALLIKKVEPSIQASASEILVTPDAAILRGVQARVLKGDQVYVAETVDTEIRIDGTQIKVKGPHRIQSLSAYRKALAAPGPAANPSEAEATAVQSVVKLPPSPEKVAPVKKQDVPPPVIASAPLPKPTPKPVPAPVAKTVKKSTSVASSTKSAQPKPSAPKPVANKPVANPAPKAPEVSRKELLNLMRAPTE